MQATDVLREQLKAAHGILEQAMDGLPHDHLHRRFEGATIQSIATIYTHAVTGEDLLVHKYAMDEQPVLDRDGWRERLDIDFSAQSLEGIAQAVEGKELYALREYAQAVYAATDECLSGLSTDDLNRTITFGPMGDMPLGVYLGNVVAWHIIQHGGEVCALKGIQGGKGLPF